MNRRLRSFIRFTLASAILCAQAPVRADDYADQFSTQSPGVVGEAAKAVVDRVFGVKGEDADIRYHLIELSNHSPINAGIRSALLPGWGQWYNRQQIKGAAVFMAISLGAYGAASAYHQSNADYDKYKAIGVKNDSSFDDYQRHRTQAYILGGATLGLWVYSIFDAYRHAYNPLWSRETSVQLAFREDGAQLEWRRRFR